MILGFNEECTPRDCSKRAINKRLAYWTVLAKQVSKSNNKDWCRMNHKPPLIVLIPRLKNYILRFTKLNMLIQKSIQRPNNKKCTNSRFMNLVSSNLWLESYLIIFMHLKSITHAYHFNHISIWDSKEIVELGNEAWHGKGRRTGASGESDKIARGECLHPKRDQ